MPGRPVVQEVEQTLAAFHAYACLTELALAADEPPASPGPHSVLSAAAERAAEIGQWLLDRSAHLGVDANRLIRALHALPLMPEVPARHAVPDGAYRAEDCLILSTGDRRSLVGVPGEPPALFWLDGDAAAVFEILRSGGALSADEIVGKFAGQPGVSSNAAGRVSSALETLVLSELAALA